jgi:hypothetical protein
MNQKNLFIPLYVQTFHASLKTASRSFIKIHLPNPLDHDQILVDCSNVSDHKDRCPQSVVLGFYWVR